MSVAQLNSDLGIEAIHHLVRPGDAIAETIARVAAGEADYAMSPIPIAEPHLTAGTLVALGVSAARCSPLLPRVPTLANAGSPGFDFPMETRSLPECAKRACRQLELAMTLAPSCAMLTRAKGTSRERQCGC